MEGHSDALDRLATLRTAVLPGCETVLAVFTETQVIAVLDQQARGVGEAHHALLVRFSRSLLGFVGLVG
jgi:hypothetical protein